MFFFSSTVCFVGRTLHMCSDVCVCVLVTIRHGEVLRTVCSSTTIQSYQTRHTYLDAFGARAHNLSFCDFVSVGFSNVLMEDVVVQFFGAVEQLQLKGHAFGEQDRCVDSLLSSSGYSQD